MLPEIGAITELVPGKQDFPALLCTAMVVHSLLTMMLLVFAF